MENMNNQGKRPDQYANSAKAAWYSVVGMIALLVLASLLTGCASTKETPKECCKTKKTCAE